ncbi:MAG: hypothetical protein HQ477_00315 [Chloroflexi bacterium]|nr:hypothetical protein [Chloroflexota bacterium]
MLASGMVTCDVSCWILGWVIVGVVSGVGVWGDVLNRVQDDEIGGLGFGWIVETNDIS